MVTEGLADHGSNGQVGDVVVIHDVKVDNVGTGLQHVVNFFTELGKVSRKDGRSNEVVLISPNIQRSGGTSRVLLSKQKRIPTGKSVEERGKVRNKSFAENKDKGCCRKRVALLTGAVKAEAEAARERRAQAENFIFRFSKRTTTKAMNGGWWWSKTKDKAFVVSTTPPIQNRTGK